MEQGESKQRPKRNHPQYDKQTGYGVFWLHWVKNIAWNSFREKQEIFYIFQAMYMLICIFEQHVFQLSVFMHLILSVYYIILLYCIIYMFVQSHSSKCFLLLRLIIVKLYFSGQNVEKILTHNLSLLFAAVKLQHNNNPIFTMKDAVKYCVICISTQTSS